MKRRFKIQNLKISKSFSKSRSIARFLKKVYGGQEWEKNPFCGFFGNFLENNSNDFDEVCVTIVISDT